MAEQLLYHFYRDFIGDSEDLLSTIQLLLKKEAIHLLRRDQSGQPE